jgi:hypothetical protein
METNTFVFRRRSASSGSESTIYALRYLPGIVALLFVHAAFGVHPPLDGDLTAPRLGDHQLRVISPNLLEFFRVNSKPPDPARVDSWDWVNGEPKFVAPNLSGVRITVNGQPNAITASGFKRRPLYAPLLYRDLRIGNYLYLRLSNPIPDGAVAQVMNDGTLWPSGFALFGVADPLRYSPAIHVNQEGYLPAYPKKAAVGYYLGDMGELPIATNKFFVVAAQSGAVVFQGPLTLRKDVGYKYEPAPYQNVYEADFSSVTTPGEYRVLVPGLGASLPFWINEGIAMDFARTYALGMFHQRSGFAVELPYTRFTHAADHLEPAAIPANDSAPFAFTWQTVKLYATEPNPDDLVQTAPVLTNHTAQLFPFVNGGTVSAPGGHFEAGDYNRVVFNGAQLIHVLVFAADSLPGVGVLDNLGIPESGDGISDVLQEAKWEADFLARMQDADGGFYYSVYPRDREYELDVLPENGDPQVVWPKNTATTAAAVAALAQCASSPRFKQAYPQAASDYLAKAQAGWRFLTNAIARFGLEGAYQKIQQFGERFMHHDDLAWAACELFLATGDAQYRSKLYEWFPDPASHTTFIYGWRRMAISYGNAVRDYAFAVSSGRLSAGQIRQDYLGRCLDVITNCANDLVIWSDENAYGTSFPNLTKAYRGGGWYFSSVNAFDLAVAHQFNPDPKYLDVLLHNMNFEAGCNPVNVCYVTGMGWKRPRHVVDQYSLNDRRVLPKHGIPVSNIQSRFLPVWIYGWELGGLSYPGDYVDVAPYAYYDRWCDDWNVSTEGSTTDMSRSFAGLAWLAARTAMAQQPWRFTTATLSTPAAALPGQPVTVSVNVPGANLDGTRMVWEAKGQEPFFGHESYTFTPASEPGNYWVEAEVQWSDGRRAFATGLVAVSSDAPPRLMTPQKISGGGFSFTLAGQPMAKYEIQVSTKLPSWTSLSTITMPSAGVTTVTDPEAASSAARYYRALEVP